MSRVGAAVRTVSLATIDSLALTFALQALHAFSFAGTHIATIALVSMVMPQPPGTNEAGLYAIYGVAYLLAGLMACGVLGGGMRPKVEACIRAATGGVERTHIIDGRTPDALLLEVFTGSGCGTMIVGRKEKATYLGVDLAG